MTKLYTQLTFRNLDFASFSCCTDRSLIFTFLECAYCHKGKSVFIYIKAAVDPEPLKKKVLEQFTVTVKGITLCAPLYCHRGLNPKVPP